MGVGWVCRVVGLPGFKMFAMNTMCAAPARLLIVDDDLPTRMVLRRLMARQGYVVLEAGNGREALEQVRSSRPDLVLMDVMMPELDGYAACAQLRRDDGDDSLPIIMLTGADELESIERAFNAGATDFITKPINWALLSERVRYALRTGQLNRELRRSRMRELSVRRIAGLGDWEWSLADGVLSWSAEFESITGLPQQRVNGIEQLLTQVHPDDQRRLQTALQLASELGARLDLEFRLLHAEREHVLRLVGERGSQGAEAAVVFGVFQDVTQTRRAEAMVDFLALHDDVTGLGNRRLFLNQLAQLLGQGQSPPVLLVGAIDVSRFARYNDSLGRLAADKLLAAFGQRLSDFLHNLGGSLLARIDGDEFGVCFAIDQIDTAGQRFGQLLHCLQAPFRVEGQELFLSCSAGFSLFPAHGAEPEALLLKAQEAQRLARKQSRPFLGFEPDAEGTQRQLQEFELERDLYQALERGQFFLVYQPQMDFARNRITGAEALLRWRHPQRGVIPPIRFIGLLEETGLINEVGAWVLQQTCQQVAQWQRGGLEVRVGVNLSPRQFLQRDLCAQVQQALEAAAVDPNLIELEITESLAMQEVGHTIGLLQQLRALGLKIAIDDFGVGHSSLEYLLRFPIDVIKVDRAFVSHITSRVGDRAIVRSITVLAQSLGLSVIAEGVETQRQCDFLEALGVAQVQGYLIGKPMPAEQFEQLARSFKRGAAS